MVDEVEEEVFYTGEVILRKEALEKGLKRYFTGKVCKHGHIDERETPSGQCLTCKRGRTRRWRTEGPKTKDLKLLPSLTKLRHYFHIENMTGDVVWNERPQRDFKTKQAYLSWNKRFKGKRAGSVQNGAGYIEIRLEDELYRAHRVAWKMFYNEEPPALIDHKDGNKLNNHVTNLRAATYQENAFNKVKSTGRYKGVRLEGCLWIASVAVNDKVVYYATFKSELEAAKHYDIAARKYHGDFAKLNFKEEK